MHMYDRITDSYLEFLQNFKNHTKKTKNFDTIMRFYDKFLCQDEKFVIPRKFDLQFPINMFDAEFPKSLSQIQRHIEDIITTLYQKSGYLIQTQDPKSNSPPFEVLEVIRCDAQSIKLKILISKNIKEKNEQNSDVIVVQKFFQKQYFDKCRSMNDLIVTKKKQQIFSKKLFELEDKFTIIFEGGDFSLHDLLKLKVLESKDKSDFELIELMFNLAFNNILELSMDQIFYGDLTPSNIIFTLKQNEVSCKFLSCDLSVVENFQMYGSRGVTENFLYFGVIAKRGRNEMLTIQDCIHSEVFSLLKCFSYFQAAIISQKSQQQPISAMINTSMQNKSTESATLEKKIESQNILEELLFEAYSSNSLNMKACFELLKQNSKKQQVGLSFQLFEKLKIFIIKNDSLVQNLKRETHYQNEMLMIIQHLNRQKMITEQQFRSFVSFLYEIQHEDFWQIKRTQIIEEFFLLNENYSMFSQFTESNLVLISRIFIIFLKIFLVTTTKKSDQNENIRSIQGGSGCLNSEIARVTQQLQYGMQKLVRLSEELVFEIPQIYKSQKKMKSFLYDKEVKRLFLNQFYYWDQISSNFESKPEEQRLISLCQYLTDVGCASDFATYDTRLKLMLSNLYQKIGQQDDGLKILQQILVTTFLWKKEDQSPKPVTGGKGSVPAPSSTANLLMIDSSNSDHTSLMSKIYFEISQLNLSQGNIRESLSYAMECVNCFQNSSNAILDFKNSPLLPEIYSQISQIHFQFCDYQEAQEYQDQASKVLRAIYGDNNMSLVESIFKQGQLAQKSSLTKQGLDFYLESLALYMFFNSGENYEENEKLGEFLNQIAQSFESLGQFDEALNFHSRCLKIRIQIYSENHPLSAMSIYNIASLYKIKKSFIEAEVYHEQALPLIKNLFGNQHSSVFTLLGNLSEVKFSIGQISQSAQVGKEAYEIGLKLYGPNHPALIAILNHLAIVYTQLGQTKEAQEYKELSVKLKNQIIQGAPSNA